TENDPGRRQADVLFGKYLLALEIMQRSNFLTRHDVDVVVEQQRDVAHPRGYVGNIVLRLHELERVGGDEPHIDVPQEHDVDEVLNRALAQHRQHTQVLAVVQHVGHVRAHYRHRATDRRGDDGDGAGIDSVALRQAGARYRLHLRR